MSNDWSMTTISNGVWCTFGPESGSYVIYKVQKFDSLKVLCMIFRFEVLNILQVGVLHQTIYNVHKHFYLEWKLINLFVIPGDNTSIN